MNQKGDIPMAIYKALKRFEKAVVDRSWKGSQPWETWAEIEEEYNASKASLIQKIKKAVTPKP